MCSVRSDVNLTGTPMHDLTIFISSADLYAQCCAFIPPRPKPVPPASLRIQRGGGIRQTVEVTRDRTGQIGSYSQRDTELNRSCQSSTFGTTGTTGTFGTGGAEMVLGSLNDWNKLQYYGETAGTGGLLTALSASRFIGNRIGEHVLRLELEQRQNSEQINARLKITTANLHRLERLELLERLEQVGSRCCWAA